MEKMLTAPIIFLDQSNNYKEQLSKQRQLAEEEQQRKRMYARSQVLHQGFKKDGLFFFTGVAKELE